MCSDPLPCSSVQQKDATGHPKMPFSLFGNGIVFFVVCSLGVPKMISKIPSDSTLNIAAAPKEPFANSIFKSFSFIFISLNSDFSSISAWRKPSSVAGNDKLSCCGIPNRMFSVPCVSSNAKV